MALVVVLPGAIQKEAIGSILTLIPQIAPEPVVALQRMAVRFYGQECSQITPWSNPGAHAQGKTSEEEVFFKFRLLAILPGPGLPTKCAHLYEK